MEAPGEELRAIERPEIRHFLDHAERTLSRRGSAQIWQVRGVDIAATPQVARLRLTAPSAEKQRIERLALLISEAPRAAPNGG